MMKTGRKIGRPLKSPPAGAVEMIRTLAAEGHSIEGIAERLGVGRELFMRWREQFPDFQQALDRGREVERYKLHNALFQSAMGGNPVPAMFLLKSRHGYREGDQSEAANRVSVTFQLPGALSVDQFNQMKVINYESENPPIGVPE